MGDGDKQQHKPVSCAAKTCVLVVLLADVLLTGIIFGWAAMKQVSELEFYLSSRCFESSGGLNLSCHFGTSRLLIDANTGAGCQMPNQMPVPMPRSIPIPPTQHTRMHQAHTTIYACIHAFIHFSVILSSICVVQTPLSTFLFSRMCALCWWLANELAN